MAKFCLRYLTSLARRGRQGRGKVGDSSYKHLTSIFFKKKQTLCVISQPCNDIDNLLGAIPLQQLVERATLQAEARITFF